MNKRMELLVSVLVPVFNADKYIKQCMDSIIKQSHNNLQIVLVDDGSTDCSGNICDEYAKIDSRIEVYHIENCGVANARNILLSKAKGDYILFVDSDDWIEKEMVAEMTKTIEATHSEIVVCGAVIEDGTCKPNNLKCLSSTTTIWDKTTCIEKFLVHSEINGALWNKLIRRDLTTDLSFDRAISYGEDALFIWQVLERISSLVLVDSAFYHYRMNAQSISHENFGKKKMSGHKVWERIAKDTETKYPDFKELAYSNFAVSDFWLLYYASLDRYRYDANIKVFQKNLKQHISSISSLQLLSRFKFIAAFVIAHNYKLGGLILRVLKKYTIK